MITKQIIETRRFGSIEFSQDDIVIFPDGMIGFSGCNHFLILQHKEGSAFRWLQSVENPDVAFLIVDPTQYVPDYEFKIHESVVSGLELTEETPHLVYTVVTIPKGNPEGMTLNLTGPIVINATNQKAKQLVLEDPRWPLRHPAVPPGTPQAKAA